MASYIDIEREVNKLTAAESTRQHVASIVNRDRYIDWAVTARGNLIIINGRGGFVNVNEVIRQFEESGTYKDYTLVG